MRLTLRQHPDSRCTAVTGIEVEVARPRPGGLALRYVVSGRMTDLRLPAVTASTRSDGLWRHTCFEAFVRESPGAAYYELNFAPSTRWAAYRFSGYRNGIQAAREISAPRLNVQTNCTRCELQASLQLDRLPDLAIDSAWRLGLAAVIEETSGDKSYWALAHQKGKADFHHSDCFALELPAA